MAGNYLTTAEVADLLSVSASTLKRWRREGKGPRPSVFEPRTVRYLRSDVIRYMKESRN